MAEMWSANGHPILFTQHPIAGLTKSQLAQQTEPLINGIIEGITEDRLYLEAYSHRTFYKVSQEDIHTEAVLSHDFQGPWH